MNYPAADKRVKRDFELRGINCRHSRPDREVSERSETPIQLRVFIFQKRRNPWIPVGIYPRYGDGYDPAVGCEVLKLKTE